MALVSLNVLTSVSNIVALYVTWRACTAPAGHFAAGARFRLDAALVAASAIASFAFHACETDGNRIDHRMPGWLKADTDTQWKLLMADELLAAALAMRCVPQAIRLLRCHFFDSSGSPGIRSARGAQTPSPWPWVIAATACIPAELVTDPVIYAIWHSTWHVCAYIAVGKLLLIM